MKKLLFIFALSLTLVSCPDPDSNSEEINPVFPENKSIPSSIKGYYINLFDDSGKLLVCAKLLSETDATIENWSVQHINYDSRNAPTYSYQTKTKTTAEFNINFVLLQKKLTQQVLIKC